MLSTSLPAVYNPKSLSPDQIRSRIQFSDARNTITQRYRLLNKALIPVNGHAPGPTGDYADISGWVETGKITLDTTQAVARKLELQLKERPGINLNTNQHVIQAFITYWDTDQTVLLDVPVGIFMPTLPDRDLLQQGNTWKITLLDLLQRAAQINFLNSYVIPAGTNYVTAVRQLLMMAARPKSLGGTGITPSGLDCGGPEYPTSRIKIADTNLSTPIDIMYGRKDNLLVACNGLLSSINYYPLWCDEVGTICSRPMPYFAAGIPQTDWIYANDTLSILLGPQTQHFSDASQIANAVVVECQNNGGDPLVSIQYNDSHDSAISLSNLGEIITAYIADDTVPDQDTIDLKAFVALQYAALAQETVTFKTAVNPLHQVHDTIGLNITTKDGAPEIVTGSTNPFEEVSWELDMNTKEMTHVVGRIVPV